jgi:hypothetical protein
LPGEEKCLSSGGMPKKRHYTTSTSATGCHSHSDLRPLALRHCLSAVLLLSVRLLIQFFRQAAYNQTYPLSISAARRCNFSVLSKIFHKYEKIPLSPVEKVLHFYSLLCIIINTTQREANQWSKQA